ncbi:helix-turn-helix domain-containing protein [Streptomyces sp. NPDC058659]|uniref:helix-turn-helix domain-containing protein n=1 Tax=unclassified Streptomyces TaxID=2593676 RepID=UPI0036671A58
MMAAERAPDPREVRNAAEFVACLQALKDWSGLTYRELAARAEARGEVLPRSTVANMLARATVPREELLVSFLRACGVGSSGLAEWQAVRKELAVRGVHEPGAADLGEGVEPGDGADLGEGAEPAGGAESAEEPDSVAGPDSAQAPAPAAGPSVVWPGASAAPPDGAPDALRPGPRSRIRRALVASVALAGLVLAGVSVVAVLRDGHGAHPPRILTAPAAGDVRIRVIGQDLCLGERRGSRSGQIHQAPCPDAKVPLYSLKETGGDRWRIVSDHPDYGPGCSGIPSGGRIPDAAYEDSECGDPSRVEEFTLEPYGTPVEGYRIVPAGSATSGSCVTVVGDRSAAWARLAQAPCAPDAAGQLFSFDRRS